MKLIENNVYLDIFKYLKEHDKEEVIEFFNKVNSINKNQILESYLYEEKNGLDEISKIKGYKEISEFLHSMKVKPAFEDLSNIILKASLVKNLDLYYENAKKISNLGDVRVILCNPDHRLFCYEQCFDKNDLVFLRKQYSDATCTKDYEREKSSFKVTELTFSNSTWVLEAENHYEKCNQGLYKYMYMKDYSVDLTNLPSKDEIECKLNSSNFVRTR